MTGDTSESEDTEEVTRTGRGILRGFRVVYGLFFGYYALSGAIGGLIILRWFGVAQAVKDATQPLGVAGEATLGVVLTATSFALLSGMMHLWPTMEQVMEYHNS